MNQNTNTNPSVLIHCQYVYGIGHLIRAVELARGLSEHFQVFLLNGGDIFPNFEFPPNVNCIQLPAIYKEESANHLTTVDASLSLEECFRLREKILMKTVEQIRPDMLITEHFPFGLLFEAEVMMLIKKLKELNPIVKIISSVRDVIESSEGSKKDTHVCTLLNKWYDMVLVHGDENIVPFSSSFPLIEKISIPVYQTGYIVRPIEPSIRKNSPPLLVSSVGGGRMGVELLHAVINAHQLVAKKWPHHLTLFTGAFQRDILELSELADKGESTQVSIHAFDKNHYQQTLSTASAIICLGGYNSLIEAVSTKLPVLVYRRKFHGANKEQDLRSALFERSGLIRVLNPEDLKPDKLAGQILQMVDNFQTSECHVNFGGVATSLKLLKLCIHTG